MTITLTEDIWLAIAAFAVPWAVWYWTRFETPPPHAVVTMREILSGLLAFFTLGGFLGYLLIRGLGGGLSIQ